MTAWAKLLSRIVVLMLKPCLGEVTGLEHFPVSGPCLLVANHLSLLDGPLLAGVVNTNVRHVRFVSHSDPFTNPFTGHILRVGETIELDNTTLKGRQRALESCRQALAEGGMVGLFPEGRTAPFGAMIKAQPGAAMLALETGAPVVPVGLAGTQRVIPREGCLPGVRWKAVSVHCGRPLDLEHYVGLYAKSSRRQRLDIALGVSTMIMQAVAALSGQTYPHGARFLERLERLSLEGAG